MYNGKKARGVMPKYDDQLYLLNALRSQATVYLNTTLSIGCLCIALQNGNVITKAMGYGGGIVSSIAGLVAMSRHRDNVSAHEDVVAVSDQVRTNDLYRRLSTGDEPYDYTKHAYNYIVMQLGRGVTTAELLATLDNDPVRAKKVWDELEARYGRLPTGGV